MIPKPLFGLIASFALTPGIALPQILEKSELSDNARNLESFVRGIVTVNQQAHNIPGLTISVVQDGEIKLLHGYGYADLDSETPVHPEQHSFRIGSVTKTFVFTALMQLVEQGRIDLDADVNDYLTVFKIPSAFNEPVRIRDLLTHRPGFEEVYRELFTKPGADVDTLENWLANNIPTRVFPPGTVTSYSNYGAALAGYIVQEVSGELFEDYLRDNILQPLNMHSTTARQIIHNNDPRRMSERQRSEVASSYTWKGSFHELSEFQVVTPGPAGSISSTAKDMANYMMAHLGEGSLGDTSVLAPETANTMRTRLYADREGPDFTFGFRSGKLLGFDTFEHGGATWTSFTAMTMVPELEAGVFISVNGGTDALAPYRMAKDILTFLADGRQGEIADVITMSEPDLAAYEGKYLTTRREYAGIPKIFNLTSAVSVSVSPNNGLIIASSAGGKEYLPVSPQLFHDPVAKESVSFLLSESGHPTHFVSTWGHTSYMRVDGSTNAPLLMLAFGIAVLLAITHLVSAAYRKNTLTAGAAWVRRLPAAVVLASLLVLLLVAVIGVVFSQVASAGNELLYLWPLASMTFALVLILFLILLTTLLSIGLVPFLRLSEASLWRKVHYALFTLVLIALLVQLKHWNLIGFNYW